MSEPRTPMSTGSTSRRRDNDFREVVTVTDPVDGTVWQHYDIWVTPELPDTGRDFYVTRCTWSLWRSGAYARYILEWQYDPPLRRPMIDEVAQAAAVHAKRYPSGPMLCGASVGAFVVLRRDGSNAGLVTCDACRELTP